MSTYSIGTCFLCQKCLKCGELSSSRKCKCDLDIKAKSTKSRKSYSRVYDPKTKSRIYNDLQLSKLEKANETYLYEMDFSQKFKYCLCPLCHNLMARLKKNQNTKEILSETSKPNNKSRKKPSSGSSTSTKLQKLAKSLREINNFSGDNGNEIVEIGEVEVIDEVEFERNLVNDDDEQDKNVEMVEDIVQDKDLDVDTEQDEDLDEEDNSDIEESENEDGVLKEITFKLVLKKEGKNGAAKWETIYNTNFNNFIKDLYILIQDQADELILRDDCTISYRCEKGVGIGTYLSNEKDWKMFLKEYQNLISQGKEMMIIASLKFKKAKSNQVAKR
jgi:hypothetical protein